MAQDMDDGLKRDLMGWVMSGLTISAEELRSRLGGALEAATTSERDACAKIVDPQVEASTMLTDYGRGGWDALTGAAQRIRERTKGGDQLTEPSTMPEPKPTCSTCQHWENVNLGRCLYVPPPIVRNMWDMLNAETSLRIDYRLALAKDVHTPADGYCDEHKPLNGN